MENNIEDYCTIDIDTGQSDTSCIIVPYTKVFVDKKHSRWINVDEFGNKDTITLKTESGVLVTRTCQYWSMFYIPHKRCTTPKCKISYKGKYMFVNIETILKD